MSYLFSAYGFLSFCAINNLTRDHINDRKCLFDYRPPDKCVIENYISYFSIKTCCGYSNELSHQDSSFEHIKYMLKLIVTISL